MHRILTPVLLSLVASTVAQADTTLTSATASHLASGWSNGLPATGNPGTIAINTTISNETPDGVDATSWQGTVTQSSGTVTAATGGWVNTAPLQYRLTGGTLAVPPRISGTAPTPLAARWISSSAAAPSDLRPPATASPWIASP